MNAVGQVLQGGPTLNATQQELVTFHGADEKKRFSINVFSIYTA